MNVPSSPPTFAEYQLIHQTQQHQRNPDRLRKPDTSDSWKKKVQLWLTFTVSSGIISWSAGPKKWLGWALLAAIFTGLGLLHQWWEYRKAYRQFAAHLHPTGYLVRPKGVEVQWPGKTVYYRWMDFYRLQLIGEWLLLYTSVEDCYYLALTDLPDAEARQTLLSWLPADNLVVPPGWLADREVA
ncbi:hypothetical protein LRS06_03840 [Hymenobacter sp. J193]|uniref:hypothetical protein n=1 Tax=Hymenobacter sp. J193 TaxID=2898429 RepID=UPI00215070A7|nr:hypothetical protein [Hymenobacter sp. J193]MCR5886920.1 hypothetical protein [Hymenobacter sp. J193]